MTTPIIDSQDYVTNPNRSHPGEEIPERVWVVYYKGLDGKWVWSLPTFFEENARKQATALGDDTELMILTYDLRDFHKVTEQDIKSWTPKKRRVRQPINQRRVRTTIS